MQSGVWTDKTGLTSTALRVPNTNAPTRPAGGRCQRARPGRRPRWPCPPSLSPRAGDGASAWKRPPRCLHTPPTPASKDAFPAMDRGEARLAWLVM